VAHIDLGDLRIEVVRKDIRNLHLSVLPPVGQIRIAAPKALNLDAIRLFALSKLAWIRSQQRQMQTQERETPRQYLERESHHLWGRRYLLRRLEQDAAPKVEIRAGRLLLQVRPGTNAARCQELVEAWYRSQIHAVVPDLLEKWEPILKVKAGRVIVQRMRTRWGGCNPKSGIIRLNTDLARKPMECLEYILVHELVHLLEPRHNARFTGLMDLYLPSWQILRKRLNSLPVRHQAWQY
jgi:predicted metal-dependent hydrolase